MNETQWRQIFANRRRRGPQPLLTDARLAACLGPAARAAQKLADVQVGWLRVADPAWAQQTVVQGCEEGVVTIGVADATLRFHLTRQAGALKRALVRQVRGVRALRFVPAANSGAGSAQAEVTE